MYSGLAGRTLPPLFVSCLLLLLSTPTPRAEDAKAYAPDTPERGSVDKIREYTTSPEFLPESVSYVPDSDTVPSPEEVLGHLAGAPKELSRVADVHNYFRRLDAASPRVELRTLGTSEEGREILLALISDASNLKDLKHYREITSRLSDPRTTTKAEMEDLVRSGKAFYYLMGGLHSTETGSPEMLMELAYRLAVSEKPEIKAIRENLIVLITPVCEPDGRDRVVDWYYRNLRDRDLPYDELEKFDSPPYWGHYAFHDNNRDGMQLTLALTRAIHGAYYDLHPQVMHDLHESLPLLYISTGHGPYNRAIDPVTVNEWTQFAHHEAGELQAQGLPGVWVWGFWDGWWPGYLFSVANNHNSIGRFYETFGNGMAGTFDRELEQKFVGKPVTTEQWYRPWPPKKKLKWSLRNNTNYMQAGVLEALHYASLHHEELLRNFWIKGERAVEKGRTEAPYAWVFPEEQRDRNRLAYLVNQLGKHHIEVQRLEKEFAAGEKKYPAGSYVVRMDQPYRNAAIAFLEEQKFPPDEPNAPYDDVAWTWPLLYGVDGARIDDKTILDAGVSPVKEPVQYAGHLNGAEAAAASASGSRNRGGSRASGGGNGTAASWLLRDTGQTALLAARVRLGRATVEAAEDTFEAGGVTYPPGSWIVRADAGKLADVAEALGLDFTAVDQVPDVRRHAVDLPRLAMLHTWTATQDCGWARYTLDQEGIPYTLISSDDLKRGRLEDRFDVILFPNTWGSFKNIVHGIDPAFGPLAYTKTAEYASQGIPDASPDITGGMGFGGVMHLDEFVRAGGVLVALGNAGTLPVDGGIVWRVDATRVPPTPGSEVRAKFLQPKHPIAYGYEELTSVFRGNLPVFNVDKQDRNLAVLQFGTKNVEAEEEDTAGERPAIAEASPEKAPAEKAASDKESAEKGEKSASAKSGSEKRTPEVTVPEKAAAENATAETGTAEKAAAPKDKPAKEEKLLLSGFVKDGSELDGKPAILDVPVGEGRVVLYSFNPLHRYLTHSDFRLVYNVILNWNDLPRPASAEPVQAASRKGGRRH
jgi:hypothetical protein